MLYNVLSGMFDYCVHIRNKTNNLNSVYYIIYACITYFVRKTFKGLKRRRLSTYVSYTETYIMNVVRYDILTVFYHRVGHLIL